MSASRLILQVLSERQRSVYKRHSQREHYRLDLLPPHSPLALNFLLISQKRKKKDEKESEREAKAIVVREQRLKTKLAEGGVGKKQTTRRANKASRGHDLLDEITFF